MKGVVFLALSEMIQGIYGHKVWNDFIAESKVQSEGIYTSTEIYDDKEADQLLNIISKKLNKNQNDILFVFGLFLIKYFKRKYPEAFAPQSFCDFMSSVESTIHVEIEKLSPRCTPPQITILNKGEKQITVHYASKRKLCSLAHGLILGAAKIYKLEPSIAHTACMHNGDNYCAFEIKFN